MNNRETTVAFGEERAKVFMQSGFLEYDSKPTPLHCHNMTEVQIAVTGAGIISTLKKDISFRENEMTVIPASVYHSRKDFEDGTQMICFQTTAKAESFQKYTLEPWLVEKLAWEITNFRQNKNCTKLPLFLGLVLTEFGRYSENPTVPIQNREFLIKNFFAVNYNRDICLGDVAKELNLSEKQTERLIIRHTGESFRKTLTRYRINAAKVLMSNGEDSLSEIAEKVGYKSYSGFWKAYNKKRI